MKKSTWALAAAALAIGVVGLSLPIRGQEERSAMIQGRQSRFGEPGEMGFEHGGQRISHLMAMLDNERVKAALGLTDDQADRLHKILVGVEESSIKTRSDIAVRGIELRELLRADKPDRDAVMKKAEEISQLRGELMSQRLQAMLDAKNVLTPEQQAKIRNFMESRREGGFGMERMMRHPQPPAARPMAPSAPPEAQPN